MSKNIRTGNRIAMSVFFGLLIPLLIHYSFLFFNRFFLFIQHLQIFCVCGSLLHCWHFWKRNVIPSTETRMLSLYQPLVRDKRCWVFKVYSLEKTHGDCGRSLCCLTVFFYPSAGGHICFLTPYFSKVSAAISSSGELRFLSEPNLSDTEPELAYNK